MRVPLPLRKDLEADRSTALGGEDSGQRPLVGALPEEGDGGSLAQGHRVDDAGAEGTSASGGLPDAPTGKLTAAFPRVVDRVMARPTAWEQRRVDGYPLEAALHDAAGYKVRCCEVIDWVEGVVWSHVSFGIMMDKWNKHRNHVINLGYVVDTMR